MDDWMLVDCGNLIVSVMDAEAREVFDLERFWGGMTLGRDPNEGLSFDDWLEKNPVPDKWNRRLERDEEEIAARRRAAVAPPQEGWGYGARGTGGGSGKEGVIRGGTEGAKRSLALLGGAPRARGPAPAPGARAAARAARRK